MRAQRPSSFIAASFLAALLTGCGTGLTSPAIDSTHAPVTGGSLAHLAGTVHGGQQPVSKATLQLYAVGITADKSAATPLISQTVLTDDNGGFDITGLWNCNNTALYGPDPLLYLVATGGNPGLGSGGLNPALALMTAVGPCSTATAQTSLVVNEVTTVAAVYALAPFMADVTHIGAASPAAIKNAFATVQALDDRSTGLSPGPGIVPGETVPTASLYTLANLIAVCINSNGTGVCQTLFTATTPPGGASPTDTIAAALQIAQAPARNAATLFSLISPSVPFQPSLGAVPNDWSLALTFTGAGINAPSGIALDAAGNAWIANAGGAGITGLNNQGSPLTGASGYTAGGTIFGAQAVAVDRTGNVWLADTLLSKVVKLTVTGGTIQQSAAFTTAINAPTSLSVDSQNHIWVTNFGDGSVTELDASGSPIGASPLTAGGTLQAPIGIAIDAAGSAWVTDNAASVLVKFDKNQTLLSGTGFTDNNLVAPQGIAIDASGRVWTADNGNAAVSIFTASGVPLPASPLLNTGLTLPAAVAIDGAGTAWIADSAVTGGLVQILPVTSASTPLGRLNAPAALAIDASGNVWTANSGDSSVTKFIGLATPAATPIAAAVGP